MYIFYCDVCEQIIKEGEDKFILAINKVGRDREEPKIMNYEDFINRLQQKNKTIRTYEICIKCKELLDKFLAMRRNDLKKLEQQLKFLEEKENE
jgi:hypothetical protein